MSISPLLPSRGVIPIVSSAGAALSSQDTVRRERSAASEVAPPAEHDPADGGMEELRSLTTKAGLELRLQALPDSDVTLIKMVEPDTGEVVREFPPEGLAAALAELRRQAAARLDRKV
jgi:uncharacterized FlaG/YvyC family protein